MKNFETYCKDLIISSLKKMEGKSYFSTTTSYVISKELSDRITYKYEANALLKFWKKEYIDFLRYCELKYHCSPFSGKKKTVIVNAMIGSGIENLLDKSITYCSLPYADVIITKDIAEKIICEIRDEKPFY